ncbi:MAG: adenosyl-hopene transferase HpnH [Desulforhabdus sp.]|jgi:hopanoid biosynthesis associated radical SAM protein HpnH|nr:adenosyl-hopene transferase HpnH [Desulforhabdus sp.]
MRFPLSLYLSMASYLIKKKIYKEEHFPLVLMLEPTHRCNLTCSGCGRIIEYSATLHQEMTLEECLQSVDEADPPVVTITGGEPLLYSRIRPLVDEVLSRGKHIYFCTNGLLLEDSLTLFRPSPRFTWNIHFDGTEPVHEQIIGRKGGFKKALAAAQAAKKQGFRVSTNTTVYRETDVRDLEKLFIQLTAAGVDGILVAPGFSYEEVLRDVFLSRQEIIGKFKEIRTWQKRFPIISNPIYMEFLSGKRHLQCTPWGNPTRNVRGWKSPCYLITDAHYASYDELMEKTDWSHYASGKDPRCAQCMVHCGYEPTVVRQMNGKDLLRMVKWNLHV